MRQKTQGGPALQSNNLRDGTVKKNLLLCLFLSFGCGARDDSTQNSLNSAPGIYQPKGGSAFQASGSYIECTASKFQSSAWTQLGKFRSPAEPFVNNGELLQNAEFKSDENVGFSASGNFDEGLIYGGSIYDFKHRVGVQIQLAKKETLDLTLMQGTFESAVQYSLHCNFIKK